MDSAVIHYRSDNKPEMRYSVEEQAPNGNWVVTFGSNDLRAVRGQHGYYAALGKTVRIIDEHK